MRDLKSFIIGFLVCALFMLSFGFKGVERGSVEYKPVYVKIVK